MATAETEYREIINAPQPKLQHLRMSLLRRAAQFAPYQALTGFEERVAEVGRLTEDEILLTENEKEQLDQALAAVLASPDQHIALTYFVPDKKKSGGAYVTHEGAMKKVDEISRRILFTDGTAVPIENVIDIKQEEHQE